MLRGSLLVSLEAMNAIRLCRVGKWVFYVKKENRNQIQSSERIDVAVYAIPSHFSYLLCIIGNVRASY